LSSAFILGAFGVLGVTTGVGLIRLWKWARYSAIGLGILVILLTLLPGVFVLFAPIPPPSSSTNGAVPRRSDYSWHRSILSGRCGRRLVFMMVRKSTVAQFDGGAAESAPRVRPISVSIIGGT